MSYPAETGAFANVHLPGGDTLQLATKQVSLVYPQWNTSGGSWSANLNWSSAAPNGPGQTAVFAPLPASSVEVVVDQPVTLGALVLGSTTGGGTSYTFDGPSSLSFDNSGSTAFINTLGGTHTLNVPVDLNNSLLVMSAPGSTLAISAGITENQPSSLTLTGSGTPILSGTNSYSGGTIVTSGRLQVIGADALPFGTSLSVGAGAGLVTNSFSIDQIASLSPLSDAPTTSRTTAPVPEPSTMLLLATGALAIAWRFSVRRTPLCKSKWPSVGVRGTP